MGCRAQPVRYPISRTVQQMTRETRMGQPSYTEDRTLSEFCDSGRFEKGRQSASHYYSENLERAVITLVRDPKN